MGPLLYSVTIDRALAGIRARVPEFCDMRKGDRVLDVCCGTGAQTLLYARKGIAAWGIDLDARMIYFGEKHRKRLGMDNAFFQRASAASLPFRDATFDCASISMGLHEKEGPTRDTILMEMRRVVKKDGALAIVDYRVPYPSDACGRAIRLLERMAGPEHFRCFTQFIQDGGLGALLSRHHLQEDKMEYVSNIPLAIVKIGNR